jgi:hypothetical protein
MKMPRKPKKRVSSRILDEESTLTGRILLEEVPGVDDPVTDSCGLNRDLDYSGILTEIFHHINVLTL